jgi:tRNA(Ile)-lysidine synthase
MHQFCKNLITEWRKLDFPFEGETLVVAVSGGADSVSLALALEELRDLEKVKLRLVIAHFNHGLRGKESDADEQFVKNLAGKYRFELVLGNSRISRDGNLEQNARSARYQFLAETAHNLDAYGVLTGHTRNDQAETFLINLIRGSGLKGLGGMKTRSCLPEAENKLGKGGQSKDSIRQIARSQILLARPILSWASREMTEEYCIQRKIEYRYDSMNDDSAFQRVRIRKILLPLLRDLNPKIVETLAKTAFILQEDSEVLENISALGNIGLDCSADKKGSDLHLRDLQNLFPWMRRKIIQEWLRRERGDLRSLNSKHFDAIENLILTRKSGREVELPNKEKVRKKGGMIVFVKEKG